VSPVHGNFMVNTGDATSADMESLIREVRERVDKVHHVKLELELRRLGAEHMQDQRECGPRDGGCST